VDLRGGLDQILEVSAGEEVAEVDEFAVLLVLNVDGSPSVLAAANSLAGDVDVALAADDGEGDDRLHKHRLLASRSSLAPRMPHGYDYLIFSLTLICELRAASSLSYSSFS
jgi:hypothetical protein